VGGEVVYSIVVPATKDLLSAGRNVLRAVLADQDQLADLLDPPVLKAPRRGGRG
jgi:hypothetical protein